MAVIVGRIQDEGGGPGLPADGQVFNVKAYGALGDGVADDTRAIADAVGAAPATGGILYFPPGRYLVSDALDGVGLVRIAKPIQLLGAGPLVSVITTNRPVGNLLHLALEVTDPHDKVRSVMIRDLKLEADVLRDADAAILQTVQPGSQFQHGIRIENCHFKGHVIGVHLQAASTSVIENCTFWQGLPVAGRHQADIWIDEQVGGDSSTHLVTGCLFADTTRTAFRAILITGRSGGERIIGNLFVYYREHVVMDQAADASLLTAPLIANNLMEQLASAGTIIRFGRDTRCLHGVITGNQFRVDQPGARVIHAEPSGPDAFARAISVVGNKLAGPPGATGIEVAPSAGASADGWSIADNLFEGFTNAIDLGPGVRGAAVGNNAFLGATAELVDQSTDVRGAAFMQRVGIGTRNVVSPEKELHLRGAGGVRPRIYLEGASQAATPGIEFAFDPVNAQRAAIIGRAVGNGVQMEFFTKSDGGAIARRALLEPDGHLRPSEDNAVTLGTPGARWKDIFAVTKTSSVDVSWGSGRTLLPVLEGAEYQLYDTGSARLDAAGEAVVELDPRFVEVANTAVPYRVLTSGARVTEKQATRFRLRGEPGDDVDYTVLAVRAGFENVRWRDPEGPEPAGLLDPARAAEGKSGDNNR
jgi:hypothetical protein